MLVNGGRLQPQAVDAERAVLGALMIDREAFMDISEILKPDSFYEPRHQKIYDAIKQLSFEQIPIDLLTVTEKLAKMSELDNVGGPAYIAELSTCVASSANI